MRTWQPDSGIDDPITDAMPDLIPALGEKRFGEALLRSLRAGLPVGSFSLYRTGAAPAILCSASLGIPDTTRDCWRAYLSGPIANDRTLHDSGSNATSGEGVRVFHITAREVPPEHRAKVYDAHGMAERVSVVREEQAAGLFALNFYRHSHQRALTDAQIAGFGRVAALLMALVRKHVALLPGDADAQSQRLRTLQPQLTARELDVCVRLLKGMTQDGIAADLGLSLPTVKTYRNRAFERLGIHFRSELFALMLTHNQGRLPASRKP